MPVIEEHPGECRNLLLVSKATETVTIDWDTPIFDGNAPITGYKFTWREVNTYNNSPNMRTEYIDKDDDYYEFTNREITLFDLTNGVQYLVCCYAENSVGFSLEPECLEVVPETVPCKPVNVRTENVPLSEEVEIIWDRYSQECTGGHPILGCTVNVRGFMDYYEREDERVSSFSNSFLDITHHCAEVRSQSGSGESQYYMDRYGDV